MPAIPAPVPPRRWMRGSRGRLVLASVLAFMLFNAIFDVRLLVAIRAYVDAAELAAERGTFLRVQDSLGPAVRQGLLLGLAVSIAVLAMGAFAARAVRRPRAEKRQGTAA